MLARDLVLIAADEPAVTDDLLTPDPETVDTMRGREDEAGDGIGNARKLEAIGPPDGEVCALSGLQ